MIPDGVRDLTVVALLTRTATGFAIRFPDLPDRTVTAASVHEVRERARHLLAEQLRDAPDLFRDDPPTPLDEAFGQVRYPEVILEISVPVPRRPVVRINITMREDLLEMVDRAAQAQDLSRSRFLSRSVESTMTSPGGP
jgi:hypothetical protein